MLRTALIALFLFAGISHAKDTIRNPGFEMQTYGAGVPEHWGVSGEGGSVSVDSTIARAGTRSARLSREPATGFVGIIQAIDAEPWAGKAVLARAWFRQKDAVRAAIWLRADANDLAQRRFLSVPLPPDAGAEWFQAQTLIEVPREARRIVFGALVQSGTLWVDSFELLDVDTLPIAAPPPKVSGYVDEAIAKIRAIALNADRVDWERARTRSFALAGTGDSTESAHASVRFLLMLLADDHSVFHSPDDVAENRAGGATGALGAQSRLMGKIGYVSIPGFTSTNRERGKSFAEDIQGRIAALKSACGWIVDLRDDTGGNMFPMVAGLAPLLDDGPLGYYVDRSSVKTAWSLSTVLPVVGLQPHPAGGALREAPVAVLMGARTASSGEATLVSFIGRPRTRTFGVPSAGRSTANQGASLSDGASMSITTAVMADRTGRAYGKKISPDELVLGNIGDAKDEAIEAATRWLEAQAACVAAR
ncbi:MAG TPA: S41 family peptidase [Usitatibacter sp.]|nr:S41 family peptidase [Usitatibacter sp.]